jgi:hypothetical protein
MPRFSTVVYISIGNSDDKLSQRHWSDFVRDVHTAITEHAEKMHGAWFSASESPYQNACWCVEVSSDRAGNLKTQLAVFAEFYGQDSIAYAVVHFTEFIQPPAR